MPFLRILLWSAAVSVWATSDSSRLVVIPFLTLAIAFLAEAVIEAVIGKVRDDVEGVVGPLLRGVEADTDRLLREVGRLKIEEARRDRH